MRPPIDIPTIVLNMHPKKSITNAKISRIFKKSKHNVMANPKGFDNDDNGYDLLT